MNEKSLPRKKESFENTQRETYSTIKDKWAIAERFNTSIIRYHSTLIILIQVLLKIKKNLFFLNFKLNVALRA